MNTTTRRLIAFATSIALTWFTVPVPAYAAPDQASSELASEEAAPQHTEGVASEDAPGKQSSAEQGVTDDQAAQTSVTAGDDAQSEPESTTDVTGTAASSAAEATATDAAAVDIEEQPVVAGDGAASTGESAGQAKTEAASEAEAATKTTDAAGRAAIEEGKDTAETTAGTEAKASSEHEEDQPTDERNEKDEGPSDEELEAAAAYLTAQVDTAGVWTRLWGGSAYGTMQAIVRADGAFVETGGTVVVATGDGYWDALAASGLAGLNQAPVLITQKDTLTAETKAEIARLKPSRILVMGGELVVTPTCYEQIKALCPKGTTRVWGGDAQATAVKIFGAGSNWSKTAVVATSDGYWDALSIAPFSYARHAPIFLTKSNPESTKRVLSDEALAALKSGGFTRVVIVGGNLVVSDQVESQLASIGLGTDKVKRLAGGGALDTSGLIASWEIESEHLSIEHLSVATSNGYWDALTGAALTGKQESVIVLVSPTGDCRALDAVYDYAPGSVTAGHVYGGPLAISEAAWARITGTWALTSLEVEKKNVDVGTAVKLHANVIGAAEGMTYVYEWTNEDGSDKGSSKGGAEFQFKPKKTGLYTVTVTASYGSGSEESASVDIMSWGEDGTAEDLIGEAKKDIGYNVANDPEEGSKFGRWFEEYVDGNPNNYDYGANDVAYCVMAVSYWCATAGVIASGLPRSGCEHVYLTAKKEGTFVAPDKLERGMLVLYDWDDDDIPDHIGIVEKRIDATTYQTIEGNTWSDENGSQDNGGCVARHNRNISTILGGVRPNFKRQAKVSVS